MKVEMLSEFQNVMNIKIIGFLFMQLEICLQFTLDLSKVGLLDG